MTSVNVTENKYSVSVTEGTTTVVTVKAPGAQGIQGIQGATGATGAGISAGDKGALTVAANLTDWTLNDSVVTSAKITDGAIVNADINASAGIAGTKISPDFGSQNITTTGNAVFGGNLTVSGTTTTIDTSVLTVEDINIELGKVSTPTDTTADGGGITLKGATDKTFQWLDATDSWTSSEHIALPDNKKLQVGNAQDLTFSHNGTDSFIENSTGVLHIRSKAGEEAIKLLPDSAVQIYHDNAIAIHTQSWGNQLYGTLQALGDVEPFLASSDTTKAIRFKNNTGEALRILHQSSNSFITNNVGSLFIEAKNGETGISIIPDGAVELYHNGVKKLQTQSYGTTITGTVQALNGNVQQFKSSDTDTGSLLVTNNTGNAFEITHTASNSYLRNLVGSLFIEPKSGETGIKVIPDGAVELYHDGTKKAETVYFGFNVNGTIQGFNAIQCNSNAAGALARTTHGLIHGLQKQAVFQYNSVDDKIYLINNTTDAEFALLANSSGDVGWKVIPDGAVELYHDNVKRAETSADGLNVTDGRLFLYNSSIPHIRINKTSGDTSSTRFILGIATGTDSFITGATINTCCIKTGGNNMMFGIGTDKKLEINTSGIEITKDIKITAESVNDFESGRVRFVETDANFNGGYIHYDGSGNKLKLGVHPFNDSTVGNDVDCIEIDRDAKNVELNFAGSKKCETTTDGLNFPDNSKLQLGDSQDFSLSHDGAGSKIENSTGSLNINTVSSEIWFSKGTSEYLARFITDGAVELYHDGTKKAETTSSGITVTGSVTTQDMNMSNLKGTANEVDSTKGSWSIQEGADDLFLINRVNGKKYKFNLTEIS